MFNDARYVLVLLSLLLHYWLPTTSATCWNKIGTDRNAGQSFELYQSCSANASAASMCCRLPGPNGQDTCQSNGLCKSAGGRYWRESCTDRSWQSPNCIKLCVDGSNADGPMAANDVELTQCNAEIDIYCCGVNVTQSTCCGNGFRIAQGQAIPVNATSTTTTTSTSMTSPSPATTSAAPIHHSNTGAIVGGVVGGIAAIAIIGGALWFLFARRRRRQTGSQHKNPRASELATVTDAKSAHATEGFQMAEIDGQTMPSELEGGHERAKVRELDGSRPGRG